MSLVQAVQTHLDAGHRTLAVDAVYDTLDDLLIAGSFVEAIGFVRELAESDLPLVILLSALTVTRPWKEKLGASRIELLEAARRHNSEDALLRGLT
jgi:hypothetical protein